MTTIGDSERLTARVMGARCARRGEAARRVTMYCRR